MNIVDREYISALAGRAFATDFSAIRYYLANEDRAELGLSLNPLIEKDWLAQQVPSTDASWYATLQNEPGFHSISPQFDSARYVREARLRLPAKRGTILALRHFLQSAGGDTLMPASDQVRGNRRTRSETRKTAIADAARYAAQLHLRRARTSSEWNLDAEKAYLMTLRGSALDGSRLVSVIMPTRDRIGSLPDAIASVQAQTHQSWELIVIDDGSTDGTDRLLQRIASEDARIRVIRREDGRGVSAARNAGLAVATGDLIAFLDSDNTWTSRFLETAVAGMRVMQTEAVYSAVEVHRDGGEIRYRGLQGTREDLLYAGNFMDLNSLVISRKLVAQVGGFDEAIRRWVDYDLLLGVTRTIIPVYLPFIGVEYDDRSAVERLTGSESASWEDVVLGKHLIDWDALKESSAGRRIGSASVLIPTHGDWKLTAAAIRSVIDHSGERLEEVIVIDNGSRRHVSAILRGLFGLDTGVRVIRMPRNLNFALANNYAASLSRGQYLVMLNNDTEVTDGWLDPLLVPLADDAVLGTQPLLLYPDGTIQTAGTVFLAGEPYPSHFLAHHPIDEGLAVTRNDYFAVTAAAMAMRASDFIRLHGFDPLFTNGLEDVDLCLRALQLRDGGFRVIKESVVYHYEGQTPNRSRAVGRNRALFSERWAGALPGPDDWRTSASA